MDTKKFSAKNLRLDVTIMGGYYNEDLEIGDRVPTRVLNVRTQLEPLFAQELRSFEENVGKVSASDRAGIQLFLRWKLGLL